MDHAPETQTVRLIVRYDGTGLSGWQRQRGVPTVQEHLEIAASTIACEPITMRASGRTDAGVHALAQVVSFRTKAIVPEKGWRSSGSRRSSRRRSSVLDARVADDDFDPRSGLRGQALPIPRPRGPRARPAAARAGLAHLGRPRPRAHGVRGRGPRGRARFQRLPRGRLRPRERAQTHLAHGDHPPLARPRGPHRHRGRGHRVPQEHGADHHGDAGRRGPGKAPGGHREGAPRRR